jgi:hypothetical protein
MQLKELLLEAMATSKTEEPCGAFEDEGYSPGEDQTEGEGMSSALEEAVVKRGTIQERCWKQGKARYAVKRI